MSPGINIGKEEFLLWGEYLWRWIKKNYFSSTFEPHWGTRVSWYVGFVWRRQYRIINIRRKGWFLLRGRCIVKGYWRQLILPHFAIEQQSRHSRLVEASSVVICRGNHRDCSPLLVKRLKLYLAFPHPPLPAEYVCVFNPSCLFLFTRPSSTGL